MVFDRSGGSLDGQEGGGGGSWAREGSRQWVSRTFLLASLNKQSKRAYQSFCFDIFLIHLEPESRLHSNVPAAVAVSNNSSTHPLLWSHNL